MDRKWEPITGLSELQTWKGRDGRVWLPVHECPWMHTLVCIDIRSQAEDVQAKGLYEPGNVFTLIFFGIGVNGSRLLFSPLLFWDFDLQMINKLAKPS